MSLSNKESFHTVTVLAQNATAFPKNYYQTVNNRHCIAEAYRNNPYPLFKQPKITDRPLELEPEIMEVTTVAPPVKIATTQAPPVKRTLETPAYNPVVLPKVLPHEIITLPIAPKTAANQERLVALNAAQPAKEMSEKTAAPIQTLVKSAPQATPKRVNRHDTPKPTNTKRVWKQGRGSIEKIDKLTGEIFHLVEEAA